MRNSDANTDSDRNGNTYSDRNGNTDSDRNGNTDSDRDGNTNSCPVRESNGYSLHATRSAVKHHGDRNVIHLD